MFNLLESVSGPRHTTTYTYEPGRNAVASVKNEETVGTPSTVSLYTYTYNALGQRVEREQAGTAFSGTTTDTFAYDYLGQVTGSSNDTETSDAYNPLYAFDEIGNRDGNTVDLNGTVGYTPNLVNEYTAVGAASPTYDADGNLTSDGTWTFTWNGENRLNSATDGSTTVNFAYDYMGRLVSRDDGTDTEFYFYDGWNRIRRFIPGAATKHYLWGLDLSGSMQGAGGVGGLLREGNVYPMYDANGNITQKSDSSGATTMAVEYDPFGNLISGTLSGEYGFSSKPQDANFGYYYYGYRWYDPVTGRWPSRDPIEENGGLNLYGFVGNAPIYYIDILGLSQFSPTQTAILKVGVNVLNNAWNNRKSNGMSDADTASALKNALLASASILLSGRPISLEYFRHFLKEEGTPGEAKDLDPDIYFNDSIIKK